MSYFGKDGGRFNKSEHASLSPLLLPNSSALFHADDHQPNQAYNQKPILPQ